MRNFWLKEPIRVRPIYKEIAVALYEDSSKHRKSKEVPRRLREDREPYYVVIMPSSWTNGRMFNIMAESRLNNLYFPIAGSLGVFDSVNDPTQRCWTAALRTKPAFGNYITEKNIEKYTKKANEGKHYPVSIGDVVMFDGHIWGAWSQARFNGRWTEDSKAARNAFNSPGYNYTPSAGRVISCETDESWLLQRVTRIASSR